jgi:hypothetical protein
MVSALPGEIGAAFGALAGILFSAGENAMAGLLNGLESMAGAVIGEAEHIASSVGHAIASALHLGSPSRLLHQYGVWAMMGLVNGMHSMRGAVTGTAADIASGLAKNFSAQSYTIAAAGTAGGGSGGGAASGNVVINVDGQPLMSFLKSELYRYNVNNGGTATGVFAPH